MTITYEQTADKNIIKKIETNYDYIYLDKLQTEIDNLQTEIDNIPKPKTKPDEETLEYFNMEMGLITNKEENEKQLKEKQELLDKIKKVK